MPRIYLPINLIKEGRISITDEKAHYLISVLRCRKGDDLIVFDGKGDCFRTTILKADRKEIITEVIEKFQCNAESNINITLVQGFLKGEKMDLVIQKTTELGVKEIIPVVTERSQLRKTRKVARWRKIAEEASRQSGRSIIPIVHDPMKFSDIFHLLPPSNKVNGLIFYEEGGMKLSEAVEIFKQRFNYTLPLPLPSYVLTDLPSRDGRHIPTPRYESQPTLSRGEAPSPPAGEGRGEGELLIIIGPEGGFTKEEIILAKEKGLSIISFGERILRAETAAISAVALVQFLLGDMG
jgi:16S rRNA (uracil1498-N3)-methyltransferase